MQPPTASAATSMLSVSLTYSRRHAEHPVLPDGMRVAAGALVLRRRKVIPTR